MRIMVFLHGTVIMHRNAGGVCRKERVAQVIAKDESVTDYAAYISIGNAAIKLQRWVHQGAEVCYLSPHTTSAKVQFDEAILRKYDFPTGRILYRNRQQTYAEIAGSQTPDIIIEDNCESIGGKSQMTFPSIAQELRQKIKSIVVREFGGIDHLPDRLTELETHQS